MDIVGCTASCFALLGVAKKLKEYASKIKNAQKEWQSYIFALDSLVHIQTAVDKLSKKSLPGDDLMVEVRQRSLISVCHSHLRTITRDAESILQKFDQEEADYKQGRRWLKLRRFGRRLRFVIDAEKIQEHFQSVEYAKSSLNLAITITTLRQNDAGHSKLKGEVRDLGKSLQPAINGLITSFSALSEDFKEFRKKMRKSMRKMERPIVNHYIRHTAPDLGVERSRTPNSGHSNRKRRKRRKRATRRTPSTSISSQESSNPSKPDSSSADPPDLAQCNENSSSLASNLSDKFATSILAPTRSLDGGKENSHGDDLSLFSRNDTDISGISGSGSNDTGTSYTSAIRMEGFLQAIVPDSTEIENCWRDSERNLQFCVDHLSEDDDGQLLTLKEPCTFMPCEHATVEGLNKDDVYTSREYIFLIRLTGVRSGRRRQFSTVDHLHSLPSFERCERNCTHTTVKTLDTSYDMCLYASHFEVLILDEGDFSSSTSPAPLGLSPDYCL